MAGCDAHKSSNHPKPLEGNEGPPLPFSGALQANPTCWTGGTLKKG